ncbi:MAG: N-acetylneuraminate synthase [Oligoflexia bacterium]|nr:N-acetylneuraminate synthase [Oligoflexia bacterium]
MKIGQFEVENFTKPYVIAEIGANHNGDIELAKKLIDEAKEAGADAVKFQSWTKDTIFSKQVYEENYFLADDYRDRNDYTLEEIVEKFSVSEQELIQLSDYCKEVGVVFSSTPFSEREVDFLADTVKVDFLKVASMDCNNYPLLEYMAKKNLPIILSTGLSTLDQIDKAVRTIENAGNKNIMILHCVANYPPEDKNVNLRNIDMLRDNYPEYPVGFSDHSIGTSIPLAAVARGACIIEKHFTLDKDMFGWDHKVSATKEELTEIVTEGRRIIEALGGYRRKLTSFDHEKIPSFRRSVVASVNIKAGTTITRENLDLKRPGTGFSPETLELIVGRVAKKDIPSDKVLDSQDF